MRPFLHVHRILVGQGTLQGNATDFGHTTMANVDPKVIYNNLIKMKKDAIF